MNLKNITPPPSVPADPTEGAPEYWFKPGHWPPRRKWPPSVHNQYRVGLKKLLEVKKKASSGEKL